jgi:hypothetical protein
MNPPDAVSTGTSRRADIWGVASLIVIVVIATGFRWYYDNWLTDFDIFTFFLPNWGYLGARLSQFEIPMWNPYLSSGTPFAGDPSGGWMYLPVMFSFSLFGVVTAFKVNVLLQALIGGIATYAFGRRIGFAPLAAAIASIGYAIGPNLYGSTYYTTVGGQIAAFIPVGLVGVEFALRADRWSARLGWSALAGIAISQMFASWPGQGLMYGIIIIGGWMVWRWQFESIPAVGTRQQHLTRLVATGLAMSAFALAFGAAGILPRLDFNAHSNIAGGDYSQVAGGNYSATAFPLARTLQAMFQDAFIQRPYGYSTAIIILALFAILTGRRRFGVPFFALISIVFIDITASESIFRPMLDIVPGFEHIHGHRPIASIWIMAIAPSMLAGAGMQYLLEGRHERWPWLRRLAPLAISAGICLWLVESGYPIGKVPLVMGSLATLLIILPLLSFPPAWQARKPQLVRGIGIGLLALTLLYPNGIDMGRTLANPESGTPGHPIGDYVRPLGKDDPTQDTIATVLSTSDPGTAAAFLQQQQEQEQESGNPFRYAGYAGIGYGKYESYSLNRMEPGVVAVLVNGRSVFLGLEQVSGYNPMHLAYYADYVEVMNGAAQDYHWNDVFAYAITDSPLFDMLNVRYVLVDATIPPDREDVSAIAAKLTEVYRDDAVIVYENPFAFPRAWIVHDVRDNGDGDGLDQLANSSANGHEVAFVNGPLPQVALGDGSIAESAVVTSRNEESMTIRASSNGDGLLVLSEVYEHNWKAWVDGKEVDILRTNHALRGIPLPAGDHIVELKYQPRALFIGIWITGGGIIAILGVWTWGAIDYRRRSKEW